MNERHVPYLATTSLKKIIGSIDSQHKITKLKGRTTYSETIEKNNYEIVGMTIKKKMRTQVIINNTRGRIPLGKLESRLDMTEVHDLPVYEMRVRAEVDKKLRNEIEDTWPRKDGGETDILKNMPLSKIDYCYVDFERKKIDFDMDDYKVGEDKTYKQFWSDLNRCVVCNKPLENHGFKHTTLNVKNIDFPYIRRTVKKKLRPIINPHINVIASWIFHKILKPTELISPNGMFHYRLGKKNQWILENV